MTDDKTWFKARTYGWGWGMATTWQGWAVYAGYVLLLAISAIVFPPDRQLSCFLASLGFLSAALVLICMAKGEKPGWRWGGH
jgi:hypothetical protein